MAEKPYTANDVAAIDAAKFQPLQKNTNEEREAIATEKEQSRCFLNHFVADHYRDLNHYDFCLAA